MKQLALTLVLSLVSGLLPHAISQQGPNKETTESVAKPRPRPGQPAPEAAVEGDKIPSKYKPRKEGEPVEGPSFRSDAVTVTVDVSVLDNKGNFIPGIPQGNFRVLEDGVPQTLSTFGVGEGIMTVCMVIEFSARFQSYWSYTWYQTLQASYGFLETLKPDDTSR